MILFLVVLFIALCIATFLIVKSEQMRRLLSLGEDIWSVTVGGKVYSLDRADTVEKLALGLGKRDSLCETCAMIFVFDEAGVYSFWMKDMRFPIDIAWILDGRIVHLERRVSPERREIFHPTSKASTVLEFNAGSLDSVQLSDRVIFSP